MCIRDSLYPVEYDIGVEKSYLQWNDAYCNILLANDLANTIRTNIISPTLSANKQIKYIVVVGDDAQIPMYRQKDFTAIANEREFAGNSSTHFGSAIGTATRRGFYLTDDAYGTPPGAELGWRGHYFWRPLQATGRLVESPAEISGMIDRFLSTGDTPMVSDETLVTGYDFLADAAHVINTILYGSHILTGSAQSLISETWTSQNLKEAWPDKVATAPDLASINAHFEHWRTLPATTTTGIFYNTDILGAQTPLTGTVAWSMGCHAGYSVPDADVWDAQTSPDYPQALARKGAAWIANTGYGYGTDDGIAGSERLMVYFTQEIGLRDKAAIGEALRSAKVRYLQNLPPGGLTPYDAKSIMEATLYGLPMYTVDTPQDVGGIDYAPPITSTANAPDFIQAGLVGRMMTLAPTLQLQHGEDGDFLALGGNSALWTHGTAGRPLLPAAAIPLDDPLPEWSPRGVFLISGILQTYPGIDPVISRPVTDTAMMEPGTNANLGWWPPVLFTINRAGETPQLSATFGFFHAAQPSNTPGKQGATAPQTELRILESSEVQVLYSRDTNDDYIPPNILTAKATLEKDGRVSLYAEIEDAQGAVAEALFTFITQEQIWSAPLEPDPDDVNSLIWLGEAHDIPAGTSFIVQAADEAGNVMLVDAKGEYNEVYKVFPIYLPLVLRTTQ